MEFCVYRVGDKIISPDPTPPISKMLAVFHKSIAEAPEGLRTPDSASLPTLKDGFLPQFFASLHPSAVTVNLGSSGAISYSVDKQNPLLPRYNVYTFFFVIFSWSGLAHSFWLVRFVLYWICCLSDRDYLWAFGFLSSNIVLSLPIWSWSFVGPSCFFLCFFSFFLKCMFGCTPGKESTNWEYCMGLGLK